MEQESKDMLSTLIAYRVEDYVRNAPPEMSLEELHARIDFELEDMINDAKLKFLAKYLDEEIKNG